MFWVPTWFGVFYYVVFQDNMMSHGFFMFPRISEWFWIHLHPKKQSEWRARCVFSEFLGALQGTVATHRQTQETPGTWCLERIPTQKAMCQHTGYAIAPGGLHRGKRDGKNSRRQLSAPCASPIKKTPSSPLAGFKATHSEQRECKYWVLEHICMHSVSVCCGKEKGDMLTHL